MVHSTEQHRVFIWGLRINYTDNREIEEEGEEREEEKREPRERALFRHAFDVLETSWRLKKTKPKRVANAQELNIWES